MTNLNMARAVDKLGDLIASSSRIVPFTGAGISTECGIPDYRSPGGIWTRYRPILFEDFVASRDMRDEAWKRRFAMEPQFAAATPGRGHRALAALYKAGKVPGLITQNIDNLHQMSGISAKDIVELHGNTTYALCLSCNRRYEIDWVRARFDESGGKAPDCTECDGPIKSATVSFGQAMPEEAMQRATELVQDCDLLIVVGSSLVVWPAAGFPVMAKKSGAKLVIINNDPTEQDDMADLVINSDIGETLGPFVGN